jgi:branched-chain amino acid transport system ATP-binding protein
VTTSLLEVREVCRSFEGVRAVQEVTFELPSGRVFGLIGPNGAGKTTLVNLITAYLPVDRGTITLRGQPVNGLKPHRLARLGVARTYQNLRLFDEATVLDNVLIGRHKAFTGRPWQMWRRRRREEREQAAAARRLLDRVGLGHLADTDVAGLSYGLRRRVEVARALATDPILLLLDEPTAGMTRVESDEIGTLIRSLNDEGVTIVLVEHNVRLVSAVCDEVAVLDWGRLIARGTPDAVWADEAVRTAYLGAQRSPEDE